MNTLDELLTVYADTLAALSVEAPDEAQVDALASRADALVAALSGQSPSDADIDAWREADRLRQAVLTLLAEQRSHLAEREAAEAQRQHQAQAYAAAPVDAEEPRFLDTRS